MKDVVVIGAGKIGATIADLLGGSGDYRVTVADRSNAQLVGIRTSANVSTRQVDIGDEDALTALLEGRFAVLSAAPYDLTTRIAEAAAPLGVHYLDLTEDVASTKRVKELAKTAKAALIPQCGLAPGFISIVAADLARGFDSLDSLKL
uniref:saccharopine dehydrogenase family protein n=1 Tax=Bosea sp. (in: a-proteobacteria) TaxID=1871050 RepID=UPI003F72374D